MSGKTRPAGAKPQPCARFARSSDPVADAVVVMHRADLMAVVPGGSIGGGGAQDSQGQDGNKEGFHCDLQNG